MPLPTHAELFYGKTLSEEQKEYVDSMFDYKLTITDSCSGSGKTTLAVGAAKIMKKPLYYFFAPVQEHVFGFTPGDEEEKQAKYMLPLTDALKEIGDSPEKVIFSKKEFRHHAWVYASSHAFWRGGNIKDATVLIDEAQNWTKHDLKKVLTRCHDTCTIVIVGHQKQMDIPQDLSGFQAYMDHAKGKTFANQVTLSQDFRGLISRWADSIT